MILIHFETQTTKFLGLTFIDKQKNPILKFGQPNYGWCSFSTWIKVTIEDGMEIIGLKSRLKG